MAQVVIRYFAAARAAAGVAHETIEAISVADALRRIRAGHDARLAQILEASSVLLDGAQVSDPHAELTRPVELDILPPFAGG